jgi:CelD/BcsL family acetyltransferase involved in cellulose biosynthesis
MSGRTVLELTDPRWADFVARQPGATPFHHPDWASLVARCYGFRAFVIATSDVSGKIRAGLPVIEVRHLRGEPKWVSLPFTDYCPPLLSAPEEEASLSSALQGASRAAGIRRVEVRAPLADTTLASSAFRHVVPLDGDPDQVFARFRRTVRQQIRQAEKMGVTVRQATGPQDLLDTFYQLHLRTRRRIGVPIQPRRFFRMLWESVISTGLGLVFVAEASGQPVAAQVCLAWNGTMIGKFSASDEKAWSLRPNDLIIWHSIKTAFELDCRCLDMGRTDAENDGLRAFKRSWAAVEEPLVYGTLGAGPETAPANDGKAGRLLASVIRHSPLVVCRAAGEALYRYAALGGSGPGMHASAGPKLRTTTLSLVRTATSGRAATRDAFSAEFWAMSEHLATVESIRSGDGSVPGRGIALLDASLPAPPGSMSP